MRLDKYVATAAGLSRSEARIAITKGQVAVNNAVCKRADCPITEAVDTVCLQGTPLACEQYVYIMLHKPAGVVCATQDKADTTVVDLLGGAFPRRQIFPAGRLDKTSTGFVLLTDDGQFAHDILSPRRHVPKQYRVVLDTPVTQAMVDGFAHGVTLADGETMLPAVLLPDAADAYGCTVQLRQGVYHQIKRMFGQYHAGVNALHRFAIGGLALDAALQPSEWRKLSPAEVRQICAE